MELKKRAVIIGILFLMFVLSLPGAAAQDDEGDGGEDDSGVTCVFCSVIIFILFLVYMAYQGSKRRNQERGGYAPSVHGSYTPQTDYRRPQYRTPPPQAPVQRGDVKCDLCGSKNLRFFEKGYVKCNDCRHVFHVSEGFSPQRGP
jgi:hypothetical protein